MWSPGASGGSLLQRMWETAVNAAELASIEKHFGRVRALAGISASFQLGSLMLVSGPNGAGKSTLLRVTAGLMRPTRGSVSIFGENLFHSSGIAVRGRIGYLGAESGLYGELTPRENLEFCARLHAVGADRVDEVMARLELDHLAGRPLRALSLGYRKRTGLARALLADPDLLLLDEPWNGLDSEAGRSLTQILRERRRRGLTAVVAAHAVGEHEGLFDGEIRIRDGRLTSTAGGEAA